VASLQTTSARSRTGLSGPVSGASGIIRTVRSNVKENGIPYIGMPLQRGLGAQARDDRIGHIGRTGSLGAVAIWPQVVGDILAFGDDGCHSVLDRLGGL